MNVLHAYQINIFHNLRFLNNANRDTNARDFTDMFKVIPHNNAVRFSKIDFLDFLHPFLWTKDLE